MEGTAAFALERPLVHCPYCKDGFDDPREVVACAGCGARHHVECFQELDGCTTCGRSVALSHHKLESVPRLHRRLELWVTLSLFVLLSATATTLIVATNASAATALELRCQRLEGELRKLETKLAQSQEQTTAVGEQLTREMFEKAKLTTEMETLKEQLAFERQVALSYR